LIRAVLFDLDDTLYNEMSFVQSGFRAVSHCVKMRFGIDEDEFYCLLLNILENEGRGKVFDFALQHYLLCNLELVNALVNTYRSHSPTIHLYDDALAALKTLRQDGLSLGIITDGLLSVQKNKIHSLGLEAFVDLVIYTDELGQEYWKPHQRPYTMALSYFNVKANEAVYVGDNEKKDFKAANELGMFTIQVLRKRNQLDDIESIYKAKKHVASIEELIGFIRGET